MRVFGLGLFLQVVSHDKAQRSAVILYSLLAATGLLAVLAGAFLDPSMRQGLWLRVVVSLAIGRQIKSTNLTHAPVSFIIGNAEGPNWWHFPWRSLALADSAGLG